MKYARFLRWLAYAFAGFVVLVIAAGLILPRFLDTPKVEAQVQRKLSEVVGGKVAWQQLTIRLLPRPHGALRKVEVEIPGLVKARVEEADVSLRLLPLFRGRAEISSVSVVQPVVRIDVPSPPEKRKKTAEQPSQDPFTVYRTVMTRTVEAMRRFAPNTDVEIDKADVEIRAPNVLPLKLDDLFVRASTGRSGLELQAKTAGNFWRSLEISAQVAYADLSGKASLKVTELRPQDWLDRYLKASIGVAVPQGNVKAEARAVADSSLECDFMVDTGSVRVSRAGQSLSVATFSAKGAMAVKPQELTLALENVQLGTLLSNARARLSLAGAERRPRLTLEIPQGNLASLRDATLALASDIRPVREYASRVRGGQVTKFRLTAAADRWSDLFRPKNLSGGMTLASGAFVAPALEQEIGALAGDVDIVGGRLALRGGGAQLGLSKLSAAALEVSLVDGSMKASASFDLDLAQALALTRSVLPEKNRDALGVLKSIAGRAAGNATVSAARRSWNVGVDILKSDASVQLGELPGTLKLAGASVRIAPDAIKIDRAAVAFLDAQAVASATVGGLRSQLTVGGAVSDATVGEKFLAWVWQIADAPASIQLKTPIQLAAPRVAWGPKQKLGLEATARFESGPSVGVALDWAPGALDIKRATIKDESSNGTVAVRIKGGVLDGRFSGSFSGATSTAMLKTTNKYSGSVSGDLRFTFDHQHPENITAQGKLKGRALDLAWLLGKPVKIESIDLEADGTSLRIHQAAVNWAEQRIKLQGATHRGADGRPVIDAQLESPGVSLDAWFPPREKTAETKPESIKPSKLWPLPVTGNITVRSDFIRTGRYKIAPVAATLVLEEKRAQLDLQQADVCGISFPLTLEATPDGSSATVRLVAQKQQLEQTARCLTDRGLLMTGEFDLCANLSSRGAPGDLLRNLQGTVTAETREGRVMKFTLLANILSLQAVSSKLENKGPKVDEAGFPYRDLAVRGHFENGRFVVDEGSFNSDVIGIAASGWISLLDYDSRLSVLVAPFAKLNRAARAVPIFGDVLGGALTSVPVGVSGDIRDPLIVPLGPAAIGSELKGIFERTVSLPGKLVDKPAATQAPCGP